MEKRFENGSTNEGTPQTTSACRGNMEEALYFTDIFLNTFKSAFYVDLKRDTFKVIRQSGFISAQFCTGEGNFKSFAAIIEKYVEAEDAEELLALLKPDAIRALLAERREYRYIFRIRYPGEGTHMISMLILRGEDEDHVGFGFSDVTYEFAKQQERFLGAVPLSPDILTKAHIGLWAFELDEGKPPRMYADEAMLELLGLQEQLPPEETYNAWINGIDPEFMHLINDAVAKMTAGEHAEVQYPWHFPDGRQMIVRCGGVRNFGYTAGTRIEGTHQNVTEVLHFDEEMKKEETQELMLTLLSSLSEAYSGLYYIEPDTGEYKIIRQEKNTGDHHATRFASGSNFFTDLTRYIARHVYTEDRKLLSVFLSPESMEAEFGADGIFSRDFRMLEKGAPVWYRLKAVRFAGTDGSIRYALGMSDISAQKTAEARQKKNRDIIEILASEYSSVYYIDLTTDELDPYTMDESTESVFGNIFRSGISYSEAFRMYVEEQVLPEDRQKVLVAGSTRNILTELAHKKTFITSFRGADGHFNEMKFVKVGDEQAKPLAVALGFADKDEELRAKLEEETTRQRNIDIIEILASEYSSVYYIDLNTDEVDPYTMNEETANELGSYFGNGIRYSDAFRIYVNNLVLEADRADMLRAGSVYNILKELADKKTFITTYRSVNSGTPHYCEMKFVKVGDSENPHAVALGFADKDEELRREIERRELAERDAAVISGLSDDFGGVYYVNINTGSEIHYRTDPLLSEYIPDWDNINNFYLRLEKIMSTVLHPDDFEGFSHAYINKRQFIANLRQEGVLYRNFRLLIEGETVYYQIKFVCDEHSEDYIIVGIRSVDATVRHEMEYQEKLEAANKSKSDFLFNMSHDIRTPMNAIIGFTQLAQKHMEDKARTLDSLRKIEASGQHLLELINEVLDMSRVESGKLHSELKLVNAEEQAERLTAICRETAQQRSIALTLIKKNIRHPILMADELHISQILMNILGNAIKYTEDGGRVSFTVEEATSEKEGFSRYIFTVEDTGIGMSKEFLKHIFEAFSREDNVSTSRIQGTGLGMAIVKRLIDYMGGTIEIESERHLGTKVTVVLDLQQAEGALNEEKPLPIEETFLKGKRVLLVEDNDLNREIAMDILEEQGLIIDCAVNGIEAVSAVAKRGAGYYDFILMDIQMPLMNGYQATVKIRKLPDAGRLPIIALSANAFETDKKKAQEAGMNAHVAKPINIRELIETLAAFAKQEG